MTKRILITGGAGFTQHQPTDKVNNDLIFYLTNNFYFI